MRRIEKGEEPRCLVDLRNTPGATWDSVHGDQKDEMRAAAFREQGGLCAYCMSPIKGMPADSAHPERGGMKIEHWAARHDSPEHLFDWGSLLGVCPGAVVGHPAEDRLERTDRYHCDTFRGNLPPDEQDLNYNPAASPPDVSELFRYSRTTGETSSHDGRAAQDIDRLNLNCARLKRNRLEIVRLVQDALHKDDSEQSLRRLHRSYAQRTRRGNLRPYCQVALWYLEREMASKNISP